MIITLKIQSSNSKTWLHNKNIICADIGDLINWCVALSNYGYFGYWLKFEKKDKDNYILRIRDYDYENYH